MTFPDACRAKLRPQCPLGQTMWLRLAPPGLRVGWCMSVPVLPPEPGPTHPSMSSGSDQRRSHMAPSCGTSSLRSMVRSCRAGQGGPRCGGQHTALCMMVFSPSQGLCIAAQHCWHGTALMQLRGLASSQAQCTPQTPGSGNRACRLQEAVLDRKMMPAAGPDGGRCPVSGTHAVQHGGRLSGLPARACAHPRERCRCSCALWTPGAAPSERVQWTLDAP